jgi:uncharacterized protein (UPF0262 family)
MTQRSLRVDPRLESAVSPARWREWEQLAAELSTDSAATDGLFGDIAEELVVGVEEERFTFRVLGEDPLRVLRRESLTPIVKEYLGVIELLDDESIPMARAEALDMAKRVVHDKGASLLGELLAGLTPDHERRRRLFSLLVALSSDTTTKRMAHRHL